MKKFFTLLFVMIACFTSSIIAQNTNEAQTLEAMQILQDRDEIIIKFNVATKDQINNDLTNIMSIDNVKTLPDNQGFEVTAYANTQEFQEFLTRNIPYEIIPKVFPKAMTMATTVAQMLAWDKYPTYSCYEQMMLYFETTYPDLVDIDTILSPTQSGNYKILVAKISDNVHVAENEPQFLYSSTLHGDEATGYYMMLRLINYLLTNYGTIPQVTNLVNGAEIWICPDANPEGTYYGSSPAGSTVASSRRANLAGYDLNRNFPDPRAGNNPDGFATQPETQAFITFADNHHFNMAANFHGGTEVVNYPWDTWNTAGNPNADDAWWHRVCTNYVSTARLVNATSYSDLSSAPDGSGVTEGGDWYVITGGRQDYMNWFKKCREVTIEVSNPKLIETQNLGGYWNTNYQAFLNYMEESLYGIRGVITDGCTGQPIKAKVFANGYDQANDSSHVYSALPVGNYHKYVNTGTYSLTFSAPGYTSQTITGISVTNGSATVVNVVLVPSASPTANFTANSTSTCTGIVQFTNTGAHPQSSTYLWNFGDGNTSTLENPLHYYTANGTYSVTLQIFSCVGNPTITKSSYITVNMPASPTVTGGSVCVSGTVNLSATGTGTVYWYDALTGGNYLGSGTSYTTPSISTTTTFYANNNVPSANQTVGPTVAGTSSNNASYLFFDVYNTMTLVSVQARAGTAGTKTITLQNSSGTIVYTTTATVNTTTTTITLNWVIPAGTGYKLVTNANSALYRKTTLVDYPYTLAGVCMITGSTAGATIFPSWFNWTVKGAGCYSPRVPVIASVLPANTAGTPSATPTLCVNTALSPAITISTTGATGIGSPTGLPAGVTAAFASNTITISGTPSASGTFNYSIPLTGGCGSINATGTITVNSASTTPTFTQLGPYCVGATPGTLPTTSLNGISGTWNAAISTAGAGSTVYTFTPTAGQCANTATMTVVVNANIAPTFTQLGPYCVGATPGTLPTTSLNGFTGTWNGTISTAGAGSTVYTFTPTAGQCATTATMTVVVNANIAPTFTQLGPYCVGATPGTLPTTSLNGFTGTWNAAISTAGAGSTVYTFTPTAGQCATTATMTVVVNANIAPTFTQLGPYCVGATPGTLPTTSLNGFTGTWNAAISTAGAGTTVYTFTPTAGQCATTATMSVVVNANITPTFTQLGPYCVGATPGTLPTTSLNGFTGTWNAAISTAGAGTTVYTFTPTAGQCATTATMSVTITAFPVAEAGANCSYSGTPVLIGDPLNGPGTITWTPATGLDNPGIAQPSASPAGTTTYTITVDNNGCIATDAVTVTVSTGYSISGKTRYTGRAITGSPAPNPPTYNAVLYNIDNVIVILKDFVSGTELARDTSDASGNYQFTNVMNGNYLLSYDKYTPDTMQWCNDVNAADAAILMYLITSDTVVDPSRSFSSTYRLAADVDGNKAINSVDVSRIKTKIGSPYTATKNFPKGNWPAMNKPFTVAGSNLTINLDLIGYGDYNASSSKYRDSLTSWSGAKSLPADIITTSDEFITTSDPSYFEVPLRISSKMHEFSAMGLELNYPQGYDLVTAYMPKATDKNGRVKINQTLDEVIANENDLLVTDEDGTIRVVYATTNHFDVDARDVMIVLGFRPHQKMNSGKLEFTLSGSGIIANQYGEENDETYLLMPKILVQGSETETGFEFTGYPNPFSEGTTITYNLPENGTVKMTVYNTIGEKVSELVNEAQVSGKHSVTFSQKNLPAGMYTFKLEFTGTDKSTNLILNLIH